MNLLDATFGMYFAPLANLANEPVSIVPDLFGEHVNLGGITVARLLSGVDGVHAYGVGGEHLADFHADAAGHVQVFDSLGAPAFDGSAIGHDIAFHNAVGESLGGAHADALGAIHFYDAAGIAGAEMHPGAFDLHGGIHDLHGGFHDLHDALDVHQHAFDAMDLHHGALDSLHDIGFGAVADHLHDIVDPGIFF